MYLILATAACIYGIILILKGSLGKSLQATGGSWLIQNHIKIAETLFVLTSIIVLTFSFMFFLPISQLVFNHFLNFVHA